MAKRIHLIRHGETAANKNGLFQGSSDMALENKQQVLSLSSKVKSLQGDCFLSSPLLRATQSAEVLGLDIKINSLLRECDMGDWELLSWQDISQNYPKQVDTWRSDYMNFSFPHGETMRGFCKRIEELATYFDNHSSDTLVAITHGGIIRHLLCRYLGIAYENYYIFCPANATITSLDIDGGRGVLRVMGEGA